MKDKLNTTDTPRKGSVLYSLGKRMICLLLLFSMIAGMLPMTAWAAWDGSGDITGGMNSVSGTTKFYRDAEHNIVGY